MEELLERMIMDTLEDHMFKEGWVFPLSEHYGYLDDRGVEVMMPDGSSFLIRIQRIA